MTNTKATLTQDKKHFTFLQSFNFNKYINYCFIGLAFSLPISKALTSLFTALLILLWLLEGDFKNKFRTIAHDPFSIAILLFVGLSIVSLLWTSHLAHAIKYIRVSYWYFAPIIIMLTSFRLRYTKYILDAFLISMFISEVLSYGIYFGFWNINNATHMFPNPFMFHVAYSIYLAFAIMILLIKIYEQKNLTARLFLGIFFATALINLFINGGRTGQLGFIFALVIVVLTYYRHSYKLLISSLLFAALALPTAYFVSPNFHKRINLLYTDVHNAYAHNNFNGSLAVRVSLWMIGTNEFIDHPLLGVGIGDEFGKTAQPYIQKYGFNPDLATGYADFNNNFVQYAAQLGIFGLLLLLYMLYKTITFKIHHRHYKILSIAFAALFFTHEMQGSSFRLMNIITLFAVFTALFNAIQYREKVEKCTDGKYL